MKDFYCFIHIEKCAGTTFSHSLKYNYPNYLSLKPWYYWTNEPGNYFKHDELKRLLNIYPLLKGIGGHTTRTFAGYEKVIKKDIKYFTFLRDPIERYMSHFNHQVNKMEKDWGIESFIQETRFNNCITKRLAGSEDVKLAKEYLFSHYDFVGLFEAYDQSLLLLKQFVFKNHFQPFYEFKNDSKSETKIKFEELSKEIQNKILENNKLDIEVYNEVKSNLYPLFCKNYKGNLFNDLKQFQKDNINYKYNKLRYYTINATRLITEKIFEPIAHKKSR